MTGADYRSDAEHAADDTKAKSEARTELPGIFLMSNSFETGGSERQFALLTKAFTSVMRSNAPVCAGQAVRPRLASRIPIG